MENIPRDVRQNLHTPRRCIRSVEFWGQSDPKVVFTFIVIYHAPVGLNKNNASNRVLSELDMAVVARRSPAAGARNPYTLHTITIYTFNILLSLATRIMYMHINILFLKVRNKTSRIFATNFVRLIIDKVLGMCVSVLILFFLKM